MLNAANKINEICMETKKSLTSTEIGISSLCEYKNTIRAEQTDIKPKKRIYEYDSYFLKYIKRNPAKNPNIDSRNENTF